jgi:hypothetical protein
VSIPARARITRAMSLEIRYYTILSEEKNSKVRVRFRVDRGVGLAVAVAGGARRGEI